MPVHDWSHVNDGVFHDFYLSWHTHLSAELNLHELPRGNYSMVERKFDSTLSKSRMRPITAWIEGW